MQELVCRADFTSFYTAYAVAGLVAVVGTTLFMKNLGRLRAAVKGRSAPESSVRA